MDTGASLSVLLLSTLAIGTIHALAPDHWVPFVSIGRAQGWSRTRLVGVTLLSGVGHVGSSIAIGSVGLGLGFGLTGLEAFETRRAEVAGLLLVGFGLAYALWGLKQMRRHRHEAIDPGRSVTVWMLVAVFVLGPCEPLIPLMFVSAAHSWQAVWAVSGLFAAITLVMMVGQTLLGDMGMGLLKAGRMHHHAGHIAAGLVIAATGLTVVVLGI